MKCECVSLTTATGQSSPGPSAHPSLRRAVDWLEVIKRCQTFKKLALPGVKSSLPKKKKKEKNHKKTKLNSCTAKGKSCVLCEGVVSYGNSFHIGSTT